MSPDISMHNPPEPEPDAEPSLIEKLIAELLTPGNPK